MTFFFYCNLKTKKKYIYIKNGGVFFFVRMLKVKKGERQEGVKGVKGVCSQLL